MRGRSKKKKKKKKVKIGKVGKVDSVVMIDHDNDDVVVGGGRGASTRGKQPLRGVTSEPVTPLNKLPSPALYSVIELPAAW